MLRDFWWKILGLLTQDSGNPVAFGCNLYKRVVGERILFMENRAKI